MIGVTPTLARVCALVCPWKQLTHYYHVLICIIETWQL